MGSISSLAENIHPDPNFEHSFDNRQEGVTVFYHRDRGEKLSIRQCLNLNAFANYMALDEYGQEYCYLYDAARGIWLYSYVRPNKNIVLQEL